MYCILGRATLKLIASAIGFVVSASDFHGVLTRRGAGTQQRAHDDREAVNQNVVLNDR